MSCPRCAKDEKVKNGKILGVQRYRCQECKYNYTTDKKRGKPKEVKRLALHMYLEGLGFESIGRVLGVSQVAVYKWVRQAGEQVKELLNIEDRRQVEHMELDELWHYIGKKNASAGSGWLLIELPKELSLGPKVVVAKQREGSSGKRSKTYLARDIVPMTG